MAVKIAFDPAGQGQSVKGIQDTTAPVQVDQTTSQLESTPATDGYELSTATPLLGSPPEVQQLERSTAFDTEPRTVQVGGETFTPGDVASFLAGVGQGWMSPTEKVESLPIAAFHTTVMPFISGIDATTSATRELPWPDDLWKVELAKVQGLDAIPGSDKPVGDGNSCVQYQLLLHDMNGETTFTYWLLLDSQREIIDSGSLGATPEILLQRQRPNYLPPTSDPDEVLRKLLASFES